MAFAFGGLGSQLDVLQLALNGALAAAHQTPELGKREILIGMGTVAPKKKMIKKLDSDGKTSWTSVEEIDQVEVTEKVQQARMLSSGVMVYEEVEVTVKKDKLRTTSEYIRIPKGNDFAEISAAQGTPLSVALLASLKSNAPSYALSEATEVFWGESTAPGEVTVSYLFKLSDKKFVRDNRRGRCMERTKGTSMLLRSSPFWRKRASIMLSKTAPKR